MIRGIHYRNRTFYRMQTLIKLGPSWRRRFLIAASHIPSGASVLDVCAGPGDLQAHLPADCSYTTLEASPAFLAYLSRRNVACLAHNLELPFETHGQRFDVAVMVISLCHFRRKRALELLEELSRVAHKVIIVEEVIRQKRPSGSRIQRAMNHLCETDYTRSYTIMTDDECCELLRTAGYRCIREDRRYMVGLRDAHPE